MISAHQGPMKGLRNNSKKLAVFAMSLVKIKNSIVTRRGQRQWNWVIRAPKHRVSIIEKTVTNNILFSITHIASPTHLHMVVIALHKHSIIADPNALKAHSTSTPTSSFNQAI
jgi:hypothetical protein